MGFLDKLSANLTNAGRTVSQSAKNFTDSNALNKEINAEKRNIQQRYAEIGQLYYEKYGSDPGADFFEQMESISESVRRIEELQSEIESVQSRRPDLVPIPESTEPSRPVSRGRATAMVCMQCGQTYDTTQVFCSSCGTKLTPQYPSGGAAPVSTPTDAHGRPTEIPQQFIDADKPAPPPAPKPEAPKQEDAPKPSAPDTPADDIPAPPPAPKFCPNCGAKASSDSAFCVQCGTKL